MKTSTLVLLGLVAATLIVDPIFALRCRVYEYRRGIIKRKEGEEECNPGEVCISTLRGVRDKINGCHRRRYYDVLNKVMRDFKGVITYYCDTDLCNKIMPERLEAEGLVTMYQSV
ncbi:hypothetical protein QR680_011056 [Steinernema hermaphroditum]|uniref:UPAR/Ly6 domain-containing protein n=1 Tax=Steinernema hermaphroditum TaxID=289476 RepID=A0AA39MCU0_9BILA|nr:hypothetical protein QR680_011056 [Steinernema hermaphroditum]